MIVGPILLPALVGIKTDKPRMIDYGGVLTPPNGGVAQTLMRAGTRHALDITPPIMPAEPTGRTWSAHLRLAKLYGVAFPFFQDGLDIGIPGKPVVDGAGQTGSWIKLRSLRRGYTIRFGQALSLIRNGRRYLYFAAEQVTADIQGGAILAIFPMLRVRHNDGDSCEIAKPMIQGSLSGNEVGWERQTAPFFDFGTITITEDE